MTKSDCKYYNWNDNPDYPSYPREYGARCERFKMFFRQTNGRLLVDGPVSFCPLRGVRGFGLPGV